MNTINKIIEIIIVQIITEVAFDLPVIPLNLFPHSSHFVIFITAGITNPPQKVNLTLFKDVLLQLGQFVIIYIKLITLLINLSASPGF
jgi:hypothetical protein